MGNRDRGSHYESLAADWLCRQGLKLLERNYLCRRGEIDLILLDGDCLCFVEVKYRADRRFGGAAYSLPRAKQQKLLLAIEYYLAAHPQYRNHSQRIDALLIQQQGESVEIDWIRNAVEAAAF